MSNFEAVRSALLMSKGLSDGGFLPRNADTLIAVRAYLEGGLNAREVAAALCAVHLPQDYHEIESALIECGVDADEADEAVYGG